jgi:hypothetical protein
MPYQVDWLVEQRIIELKIIGLFTLAELKEVDAIATEMAQSSAANDIHLLFDLTKMTYSPPLSAMRSTQLLRQSNIRWGINYGTFNPLFRVMTTPLLKIFGIKQRFFANRAEALRFLQSIDASLPPLLEQQEQH